MDMDKPVRMVGWEYMVHPDTRIMIGWTIGGRVHTGGRVHIGGRVHGKSRARKVTHLSSIQVLVGLTSEFPWDLVKALGLDHHSRALYSCDWIDNGSVKRVQ